MLESRSGPIFVYCVVLEKWFGPIFVYRVIDKNGSGLVWVYVLVVRNGFGCVLRSLPEDLAVWEGVGKDVEVVVGDIIAAEV